MRLRQEIELPPPVGRGFVEIEIRRHQVTRRVVPGKKPIGPTSAVLYGAEADVQKQMSDAVRKSERRGQKVQFSEPQSETTLMANVFDFGGQGSPCFRFAAKVVLASVFREWGQVVMGSPEISHLRAVVNGEVEPDDGIISILVSKTQDLMFEIEEHCPLQHTVWLSTTGTGSHVYVSIFGILAARVQVAAPRERIVVLPDRVLTVDFLQGKLQQHSAQLFAELRGLPVSPERLYSSFISRKWLPASPVIET